MPTARDEAEETGRRSFLARALGVSGAIAAGAGGGLAADAAGGYAYGASQAPAAGGPGGTLQGSSSALPFHGVHQAGILPAPTGPRQAAIASFDVTASSRTDLAILLRILTERARFLTSGGTPPAVAVDLPASDTGILGATVVPDGLTVIVGVGASLFDRYGLAASKPARFTAMSAFPNDQLDPAMCGGDLVVQLSAGSADTVVHALRDISQHTTGLVAPRWRIDGFASPPRPAGTIQRNLLGFMDGISNPGPRHVWAPDGSSYLVIRLIRMLVEQWDRLQLAEQEHIIGRRRATGYPIGKTILGADPGYAQDPLGVIIPLAAHIRLANPRTPQTEGSRLLRRSYNYDRGLARDGTPDTGLIFTCYQKDITEQFETVQRRLTDEPLSRFTTVFGGGYFLVLPGIRDGTDHYGRALLA